MKLFVDLLGWIGSIEVILAYLMISSGKTDSKSVLYQVLNLKGAAFLIANTLYYGAYPSSFVNFIWVGIAIFGLVRSYSRKKEVG